MGIAAGIGVAAIVLSMLGHFFRLHDSEIQQRKSQAQPFMTVQVPPFFGLILRKNEHTRDYIDRRIARLRERSRGTIVSFEEDEHLIAFTVAMNGYDLGAAIGELEMQQAVCGTDFVATGSAEGVLGDLPDWLSESTEPVGPYKQLTKFYSLAPSTI